MASTGGHPLNLPCGRRRLMTRPVIGLLAALLVPALGSGWAEDVKPKVKVARDVVYGKGGDQDMQLDLAHPEGKGPFPAIVCIHGGGWQSGKRQDLEKLTELCAERGFVAVTVSYRLTPKA